MKRLLKRDNRVPAASSEVVSRVMRANKAKDTKPELIMRKSLSALAVRGYRLNWKKAHGRPDIAFPRLKIAVIVNGCFWHNCRRCKASLPKSHASYWAHKLESNRKRDAKNLRRLKRAGWRVFVVWEHDIKRGREDFFAKAISRVVSKERLKLA